MQLFCVTEKQRFEKEINFWYHLGVCFRGRQFKTNFEKLVHLDQHASRQKWVWTKRLISDVSALNISEIYQLVQHR